MGCADTAVLGEQIGASPGATQRPDVTFANYNLVGHDIGTGAQVSGALTSLASPKVRRGKALWKINHLLMGLSLSPSRLIMMYNLSFNCTTASVNSYAFDRFSLPTPRCLN